MVLLRHKETWAQEPGILEWDLLETLLGAPGGLGGSQPYSRWAINGHPATEIDSAPKILGNHLRNFKENALKIGFLSSKRTFGVPEIHKKIRESQP